MKLAALVTLNAAALAAAQSIPSLVGQLPSCAVSPLLAAVKQASSCGPTDYSCQCEPSNKAKIQDAATEPIAKVCSGAQISQVLKITSEICKIADSSSSSSSSPSSSSASSTASSAASSSPSSSSSSNSAIASLVAKIPACAVGPIQSAVKKVGCGITDYACQCQASNKNKIQADATPDVSKACSGSEISQTLSITTQICKDVAAAASSTSSTGGSTPSPSSGGSAPDPAAIPELVAQIPSCAVGPIQAAIKKSGCGLTDYKCQCEPSNKDKIQADATAPVSAACSPADVSKTLTITDEICKDALGTSSSSGGGGGGGGSSTPTPSPLPFAKDNQILKLVGSLPKCATSCLINSIAKSGLCGVSAYRCQCIPKNKLAIQKIAVPCFFEAGCSIDQLKEVNQITTNICEIALPSSVSTSASSGLASLPTAPAAHFAEAAALLAAAAAALVL